MYDPNDIVEIEIEGIGKFKSRLMTERQLKEFNRATEISGKMTLESHHQKLNDALSIGLVDADLEAYTLAQKIEIVNQYPWAITNAELDRLKKAAPSPSDSQTS